MRLASGSFQKRRLAQGCASWAQGYVQVTFYLLKFCMEQGGASFAEGFPQDVADLRRRRTAENKTNMSLPVFPRRKVEQGFAPARFSLNEMM